MANTTYALVADFETRTNSIPGDTADDPLQQYYLNVAAEIVDHLTRGYRQGYEAFSESASETRLFDDWGGGVVQIDDLLTLSAITRVGNAITSDYYKLWPYNTTPKTEIRVRLDAPPGTISPSYWYGVPVMGASAAQIAITGTWGYCAAASRPPLVKELTLQVAEMLYMELGMSNEELMEAVRNPVTDKAKRIANLAAQFKREQGIVLA